MQAFTDALRGTKPGQELKFEVTYPGDFGQKRLAGKTVAYAVEVRGIRKKVKPELNDEFAKEMGKYESLEDFEKQLRDHLASDKKHRVLAETRNRLVDALVAKFAFPVPESIGAEPGGYAAGARTARAGGAGYADRGHAQAGFRPAA